MMIRIVVRELEAWLMGDTQSFAQYFRIPARKIPLDPESIENQIHCLVDLVRHSSPRGICNDIMPPRKSPATTGRGYAGRIEKYIAGHWRPAVAQSRCDTLRRCMRRLSRLAGKEAEHVR